MNNKCGTVPGGARALGPARTVGCMRPTLLRGRSPHSWMGARQPDHNRSTTEASWCSSDLVRLDLRRGACVFCWRERRMVDVEYTHFCVVRIFCNPAMRILLLYFQFILFSTSETFTLPQLKISWCAVNCELTYFPVYKPLFFSQTFDPAFCTPVWLIYGF